MKTMILNSYFGLSTLTLISLLTCLDRSAIGAVLTEMNHYFKLTSSQTGLLGTLYPIGQVLAGPFFGYLGDRYPRKWIIIGALTLWNFSSLGVSELRAEQYYFLFLARFFNGVGSAGFFSVSSTCIADLFEPEKRKGAFSVFYMVTMIGVGLGFMMGSFVLNLGNWRWAYRIGPGLSVPLIGCLLIMKEPKRGALDGAMEEMKNTDSVISSVRYLLANRSYVWCTIAYTCFEFYEVGYCLWLPSFLMYVHPEIANSIPGMLGLLISLFGVTGVYTGSFFSRILAKYSGSPNPLICAIASLSQTFLLSIFISITGDSPMIGWFFFAGAIQCGTMFLSAMSETIVEIFPPNKRAFADSMSQVMAHLLGSATGPYFIGLIKSYLEERMEDKYHAFYISMTIPLAVFMLGGLSFLQTANYFVEDKKRAEESIGGKLVMAAKVKSIDM